MGPGTRTPRPCTSERNSWTTPGTRRSTTPSPITSGSSGRDTGRPRTTTCTICGNAACTNQSQPAGGRDQGRHGVALPAGTVHARVKCQQLHSRLQVAATCPSPCCCTTHTLCSIISSQQPINADYIRGALPATGRLPDAGDQHGPGAGRAAQELLAIRHRGTNFPDQRHDPQGQLGLRYERTDDTIGGLEAPLQSLAPDAGDKTAYHQHFGPPTNTMVHQ